MVALPELSAYSQDELRRARSVSPAIDRYLGMPNTAGGTKTEALRQKRNRAWITAALAVVLDKADVESVCRQWSLDTVAILQEAWIENELDQENLALVAMGKLGAMELNLSSDIDIFFVADQNPTKIMLKKVRRFLRMISDTTPFGYGHRVDMTIRPGGPNAPLVCSFEYMSNHYGYHGETWERSALIRSTALIGPDALLKSCSVFFLKSFSYRRHLDLNLFRDLNLMRERIRAHHPATEAVHLKLHPGGIRELELLVHALQLIHGGRNPDVQTRSMTKALYQLERKKLIDQDSAAHLLTAYWMYRDLENRIQLIGDQHTYLLPRTPDGFITAEMIDAFLECSKKTNALTDALLAPYSKGPQFIPSVDLVNAYERLELDNEDARAAWNNLVAQESRSKSKDRDEMQRRQFLATFLDAVNACGVDNAMAIFHMEKFIAGSKAKTSLFALFNSYKELVEELAWMFSCSPLLSGIFIHRPELIDSFLLKSVEIDQSSEETLYVSLKDHKLLAEVISASQFLRKRNIEDLTRTLSQTTDTIIAALLESLEARFQARLDILALGKWASRQMGLSSDLDFVFLRGDGAPDKQVKMARRFINFLQSPSSGQTLYSIDLRLRPSGNAGPLISTLPELREYLNTKSQAWERQAYLMNRVFSDGNTLELFDPRPLSAEDMTSLRGIREQLLDTGDEAITLKKSRGGLLHTELTLQAACLHAGIFPKEPTVEGLCNVLSTVHDPGACSAILAHYSLMRTYQQLFVLIGGTSNIAISEEQKDLVKICKIIQNTPKVVVENIRTVLTGQKTLLNTLDPLS